MKFPWDFVKSSDIFSPTKWRSCLLALETRWKAWRKRLGLADASAITVVADGAKWIWEEQLNHLRDAKGVLDVFQTAGNFVHQVLAFT